MQKIFLVDAFIIVYFVFFCAFVVIIHKANFNSIGLNVDIYIGKAVSCKSSSLGPKPVHLQLGRWSTPPSSRQTWNSQTPDVYS